MSNIFEFNDGESRGGYIPLRPITGSNSDAGTPNNPANISRSRPTNGDINLVKKYSKWSSTNHLNLDGIINIPSITLKEKEIVASTLLIQSLYSIGAARESAGNLREKAKEFLPNGVGKGLDLITDLLKKGEDNTIDKLSNYLLEAITSVEGVDINKILEDPDPYKYLYKSKDTGFEYILPFFEDPIPVKTSSYSESYSGDGLGGKEIQGLIDEFKNAIGTSVQGINAISTPGLFIENTYFYKPTDGGTVQVRLNLLNTFEKDDLNFNAQLVWMLLYQNSIKRIDKTAYVPPCIYEVTIPGRLYMAYAYISSIDVKFVGNRRRVNINIPRYGGNNPEVESIVPEVYELTLTIKNLTTDTGDLLIESGRDNE